MKSPDLLRLAGNDSDKPFDPAHHRAELHPFTDAVLLLLFPELDEHERFLDRRQKEVDAMRGNSDKVRTEEQLNDQQRLTRSIRFACRTALACLVARPRTWKQWTIREDESTVWQRAADDDHRVVKTLFGGNRDAIDAMNRLALEVRRREEDEIKARSASPEHAITNTVVSAIAQMREDQAKHNEMIMTFLMGREGRSVLSPPSEAPPAKPPSPVQDDSAGARIKHKRETQNEGVYFSSWSNMADALEYARSELAPREKAEGASWRVRKREDGREDKSRDKQWRCYRSLAIAVGLLVRDGQSEEDAMHTVQARFESFGSNAHTPLLRSIHESIKSVRAADALARDVLKF